jgi:YHS domain-containing protein
VGKTVIALAILVVFAVGIAPAMAAAPAKNMPAKPAAQKKPVPAICPVLGTKIPDATKAPGGSTVYKGKTYYFCCKGCKAKFLKDPEKYLKKPAKPAVKKTVSAICPVMGTKIPDVTKAPGGSTVYKGKTYYFCCPQCKPMFLKNPEKYIKQMQEAQKKQKAGVK